MNASELKERGFTEEWMDLRGRCLPVYKAGEGPGIVLIHEMPGITPQVVDFAQFLVDNGFTVWMPYLFAREPGPTGSLNGWGPALRICVSGQLMLLSTGRTSPLTDWLRALARHLHQKRPGPGVGVIGMCFSGGFALATVIEPAVLAPVMSQPALPFPVSPLRRRAFGLSPSDAIAAGRRIDRDGLCVLGLRFKKDLVVPAARFERLRQMLKGHFLCCEIPSGRGTGISRWAHSVLTRERTCHPQNKGIQEAVDTLLRFLDERLRRAPPITPPVKGRGSGSPASPAPA
ncbi:MAG: dienelactone hydrolase family protein [Actinomycetota bacterium]